MYFRRKCDIIQSYILVLLVTLRSLDSFKQKRSEEHNPEARFDAADKVRGNSVCRVVVHRPPGTYEKTNAKSEKGSHQQPGGLYDEF